MNLSIVIPAHNVEKHIVRTIASLENQGEGLFEVIIVDDGCTDNTYGTVENIIKEKKLKNFRIVRKENGGVSSARNRGLMEASGKYILFLDGDDFVSHKLTKVLCKAIENNDSDMIFWEYKIVKEGSETEGIEKKEQDLNPEIKEKTGVETLRNILYDKSIWICTISAVYKRDFLLRNNLQYVENCASGEDQEFTFKALSKAKKVLQIDKVLSYYLERKNSVTQNYNIRRFDAIAAMKRTGEYLLSSGNEEMKEISRKIQSEHIITNYISNYCSCLNIIRRKQRSAKKSYEILHKDLEENYPGLYSEINLLMKNYRGSDIKFKLKTKLFLASPFIYAFISDYKTK